MIEKKQRKDYLTINWNGGQAIIIGNYIPEVPEVRYYKDGSGDPGEPSDFEIDEMIINNEPLSEDEIKKIYDDVKPNGLYDKLMQAVEDALALIDKNHNLAYIEKYCKNKKCKKCEDHEWCEATYYRDESKKLKEKNKTS